MHGTERGRYHDLAVIMVVETADATEIRLQEMVALTATTFMAKDARPEIVIMEKQPGTTLQPDELRNRIFEQLVPFDKMSFLERYAMFMGKSQIIEMGMKRLLRDRYGIQGTTLEKLTLGQVITQLEGNGLRNDFIEILKEQGHT